MQYTKNLNLKKPDQNDYVNITDINENMDVLDESVQKKYEKPTTGISKTDLSQPVQDSLQKADNAATQTRLDQTNEELAIHQADYTQFREAIEKEVAELEKANALSSIRSSKDTEGIFTTVTYKRKTDGTIFAKSVLSGGTTPRYTTRTLTFYNFDGITVRATKIFTLSYDADGDLISEV